jgi:hypothetical protein
MKMMKLENITEVVKLKSTSILTGVSVLGLVGTAVLSAKGAFKASKILDNQEGLTTKEIVVKTWKCYLPAIIVGGVAVSSMVWSNSIALKRIAALTGMYSMSQEDFRKYREKVATRLGLKKDKEIGREVITDKIKQDIRDGNILETGNGSTLCYDPYSGRYFKSDINKIRAACVKLSSRLLRPNVRNEYLSLNDLYELIGLDDTRTGGMLTWSRYNEEMIEPCFEGSLDVDDNPCLVLEFVTEPTTDNWEGG